MQLTGGSRRTTAFQGSSIQIVDVAVDGGEVSVTWRATFGEGGRAEIEVSIFDTGVGQRNTFEPLVEQGQTITRTASFSTGVVEPTEAVVTALMIEPEPDQAQRTVTIGGDGGAQAGLGLSSQQLLLLALLAGGFIALRRWGDSY